MYWKIVLVNIFGQSIGFGARSLLSTHFLSTHLQSKSVAISLQCYPNICYQTHLLSTQLWSHSFAIKPHLLCSLNFYRHIYFQASLANRPTCHQSSVTINNFAFNHHLPKDFQLDLNPYFQQFFPQTSAKKIETFLKILSSSFSGKLSWALGMEPIYC